MSAQQIDFLTRTETIRRLNSASGSVYGSFSSTQTQNIATIPSTPTSFTYNTSNITSTGVALVGSTPSAFIEVGTAGVYRAMTSVQLNKSGGGGSTGDVYVWFAVNGNAVPNSATKMAVANSNEAVMAMETLLVLSAGDRISVRANSTNGGEQALAEASSGAIPAVPSIKTVVQRIA